MKKLFSFRETAAFSERVLEYLPDDEYAKLQWFLLEHPEVEVVWVNEAIYQAAFALLEARADKGYSLCDAVSFVLMRERGLAEALTTDHHFEQERFSKLL